MLRGEAFVEPTWKPEKGSAKRARVKQALARETKEDEAKAAARKRDGHRCRWPHRTLLEREVCRRTRLEAAHHAGKGMGGNPDGSRNVRKNLILFCVDVHQGPKSIHAGMKRVVALDPARRMDGPCAYESKIAGRWVEVGREVHIGILERRA